MTTTAAATTPALTVANTILSQLGGRRFLVMTGAKGLVGGASSLKFDLPRRSGNKVNMVVVTLTPADTYTVEFMRYSARSLSVATVAKDEDVYCDRLQASFTEHTGLACSL